MTLIKVLPAPAPTPRVVIYPQTSSVDPFLAVAIDASGRVRAVRQADTMAAAEAAVPDLMREAKAP